MKLSFLSVTDAYNGIQPVFTSSIELSNFSFMCNGFLADSYQQNNIFGGMPHAMQGSAIPRNINDTKIITSTDNIFYFFTLNGVQYIDLDAYGNFSSFFEATFTESPNLSELNFSSKFLYKDTLIAYASDTCKVFNRNGLYFYTSAYVTFHHDKSNNSSFIMLYQADSRTSDGRVFYYVYKIPLSIKYTNCCLKQCFEPTKYIYYKDN